MTHVANLHADVAEVLLTEEEIAAKVRELGARISADYAGRRLTLVSVLKGSLPFMADLMRAIDIPVRIDLMEVSSYGGSTTESSGLVRILKDLSASIVDEDVLIVEDIIDTGLTLNYLIRYLRGKRAASLRICTLLDKPARRLVEIKVDYTERSIEKCWLHCSRRGGGRPCPPSGHLPPWDHQAPVDHHAVDAGAGLREDELSRAGDRSGDPRRLGEIEEDDVLRRPPAPAAARRGQAEGARAACRRHLEDVAGAEPRRGVHARHAREPCGQAHDLEHVQADPSIGTHRPRPNGAHAALAERARTGATPVCRGEGWLLGLCATGAPRSARPRMSSASSHTAWAPR